mmetsp:Transcript_41398/g.128996  ORF Transcript_41398/g.128996 Transcript_41398/m.128996 type:complete len:298 (-) Transcript_41398:11-904(-)
MRNKVVHLNSGGVHELRVGAVVGCLGQLRRSAQVLRQTLLARAGRRRRADDEAVQRVEVGAEGVDLSSLDELVVLLVEGADSAADPAALHEGAVEVLQLPQADPTARIRNGSRPSHGLRRLGQQLLQELPEAWPVQGMSASQAPEHVVGAGEEAECVQSEAQLVLVQAAAALATVEDRIRVVQLAAGEAPRGAVGDRRRDLPLAGELEERPHKGLVVDLRTAAGSGAREAAARQQELSLGCRGAPQSADEPEDLRAGEGACARRVMLAEASDDPLGHIGPGRPPVRRHAASSDRPTG